MDIVDDPFGFFLESDFDDWRIQEPYAGLFCFRSTQKVNFAVLWSHEKTHETNIAHINLVSGKKIHEASFGFYNVGIIATPSKTPQDVLKALKYAFCAHNQRRMNRFQLAMGAIMHSYGPEGCDQNTIEFHANTANILCIKNRLHIHRIPLDGREIKNAIQSITGIAHRCLENNRFYTHDTMISSKALKTAHERVEGLQAAKELFPKTIENLSSLNAVET